MDDVFSLGVAVWQRCSLRQKKVKVWTCGDARNFPRPTPRRRRWRRRRRDPGGGHLHFSHTERQCNAEHLRAEDVYVTTTNDISQRTESEKKELGRKKSEKGNFLGGDVQGKTESGDIEIS